MTIACKNIVVVGTSAGGIEVLLTMVRSLPRDLDAALLVVLHVPTAGTNLLPTILARNSVWPVAYGVDGEAIVCGRVYIAPTDRHMTVKDDILHVSQGPKEHGFRPSIDTLFRSAAASHGRRVVGVLASGLLDDGVSGLLAIKEQGGRVVVQDPLEAQFPSMVLAAIDQVAVDAIVPATGLCEAIRLQVEEMEFPSRRLGTTRDSRQAEPSDVEGGLAGHDLPPGSVTFLTCPECHGSLWESHEGNDFVGYQCHTGHRYSGESLAIEQARSLDKSLNEAYRAAKELVFHSRGLALRARARDSDDLAESLESRARHQEVRVGLILAAIDGGEAADDGKDDEKANQLT